MTKKILKRKKIPNKRGRKTILDDELFTKIKKSILKGNNIEKTAKACKIKEHTFYTWHSDNYLKLADKIELWKVEKENNELKEKLDLANDNLKEFLGMDTKNTIVTKKGEAIVIKDTGLVRVKADMTKFTLETLGKKDFGKNVDLTSGGQKIESNKIIYQDFKDETKSK